MFSNSMVAALAKGNDLPSANEVIIEETGKKP